MNCHPAITAAALLTSAGCGNGTPTQATQPPSTAADIQPLCVEGCLDPDPDSTAAGYFFAGTENQWAYCADGTNDQDGDGLDDDCEFKLALAFRPQLSTGIGDDVNGEPRWAAQWLDSDPGSKTVSIAYLLSYWIDLGLPTGPILTACLALGGGFRCGNHAGDSEWVVLDVKYYSAIAHWVLVDAYFSAHEVHLPFALTSDTALVTDSPHDVGFGGWFPALLQYPDKKGGYPLVYVSDRKHANYPTDYYCDSHGPIILGNRTNYDNCDSQRNQFRISLVPGTNIGSRSAPFIDCISSGRPDHPNYGSGRTECYWTSKPFAGWFSALPAVSASPYSGLLAGNMGF